MTCGAIAHMMTTLTAARTQPTAAASSDVTGPQMREHACMSVRSGRSRHANTWESDATVIRTPVKAFERVRSSTLPHQGCLFPQFVPFVVFGGQVWVFAATGLYGRIWEISFSGFEINTQKEGLFCYLAPFLTPLEPVYDQTRYEKNYFIAFQICFDRFQSLSGSEMASRQSRLQNFQKHPKRRPVPLKDSRCTPFVLRALLTDGSHGSARPAGLMPR